MRKIIKFCFVFVLVLSFSMMIGMPVLAGAPPSAPTATTVAATSITISGATLNGTVNANNASTTVTFEYGLTAGYGSGVTANQSPVTGTTDTPVSAAITGLNHGTIYHYRVDATNSVGTTNGTDLTFTTLGPTYWKESGIVLWTVTRHARLTGDKDWLREVWPKLDRDKVHYYRAPAAS